MLQVIEASVQQNLVMLLVLGCTVGVGYVSTVLAPKAKKFIDAHVDAATAAKVDTAIDRLTGIAEDVVQHFNQIVVNDAKAAGTFTPDVAKSVLNDAVAAVKSQGASFVSTLTQAGNDAEGLIVTKIQSAVGKYKLQQELTAPTMQSTDAAPSSTATPLQPAVATA